MRQLLSSLWRMTWETETASYGGAMARLMKQALEGAPKLDVEDGIDDRVEEAVDVAEPDEERKQAWINATHGQHVEQVIAQAIRVDDVEGKEWDPTQQEYTYAQNIR